MISAVEELGETYTSGRINRLEFEQRSALVETFAKHKIEVANNAAAAPMFYVWGCGRDALVNGPDLFSLPDTRNDQQIEHTVNT